MLNKGKLRRNKVRTVLLTYIFGPSEMCMILLKGTKLSFHFIPTDQGKET